MINRNSYKVNWRKLVENILIVDFRNDPMIEWCMCFVKPFSDLLYRKQKYRDQVRYKMTHNSQVIYLEKYLNETYEIAGYNPNDHQNTKEIKIITGSKILPLFVFQAVDDKPVFLDGTVFIQTQEFIDSQNIDFVVEIPVTLTYKEDELRAHIDFYIDTKNYKIIEV